MSIASRDRRRWFALGALALAMLTIGLDVTVLTVALPTLAADLGANNSQLQWFSSAYTLVLAAAMLPAGALGDRYGRKKLLLGALALFGAASLACSYAGDSGQLILARAVLGLAAATMIPLSMAVLPVLFGDPDERSRALTIWVTSTAIGLPLGPILGGWLLDNFWWGSVFLINVPLVVVGAVAVAVLVPESRTVDPHRPDYCGAVASSIGLLGLTYGFIEAGQRGWGSGISWLAIVSGTAMLAAFAVWERRAKYPLIDVNLFRARGFRWGTAFTTLVNFGMFGLFFTVPQYFQAVLGVDALGSGLRLLPLIGGLIIGIRIVDVLLRSAGPRPALVVGFALLAAALALGATTSVGPPYWFVAGWIALVGAGMGMVMPAVMGVAIDELSVQRAGSGSALIQALRQAGGTIGVAILGTVLATRYRSQLGGLNSEPISDGVNAGVAVAKAAHDPAMLEHVQASFMSGMSLMLWVCTGSCALAAVLAIRAAPRARDRQDSDASQSVHVG
ncbi:MFS transporter [Skermania sp. ID1734]|uniref:MFS transporter n=1 Tax=Skermania sp. ID1734 TaxID=2597516 RepID=UPI00118117DE|nr:MFS transporter [Skermania sp. ID1734]TSE02051.1 MFS transporter [Skermania sp. ID1734]